MYDYIFTDQEGRTIVPFWWQFHPSQIMDFYDFFDKNSLLDALENDPEMTTQIGTAVINVILYHMNHHSGLLQMAKDERRLFNILKQYSDKAWIDLQRAKESGAKGGKAKAQNDQET